MNNIKGLFILIAITSFYIMHESVLLSAKTISYEKITKKHVEEYGVGDLKIFIIRFSSIIYDVHGKKIRIPIFKGDMGDAHYNDFREYYRGLPALDNDEIGETGFLIKTKKGEMKKTFHEFLAFYKSNILKDVDIEHPVTIYLSPVEWIIQYNFVVDGVPCYMHINFESRKEDTGKPLPKSVYDIVPNENAGNPGIFFQFYRGRSVPVAK